MGKSTTLQDIDDMYIIRIYQHGNKGILFIVYDRISGDEIDRFLWEKGPNIKRLKKGGV